MIKYTQLQREKIMLVVWNNIKEISEKTTLGYNGYYQYITWEITKDEKLFSHWLGGNESTKIDEDSLSFTTKIYRETDFLIAGCIDNYKEEIELYVEPELLEDYKSVLINKNLIASDGSGKILDIQDFKGWCYDQFYSDECMEFLLERIEEQLIEEGGE